MLSFDSEWRSLLERGLNGEGGLIELLQYAYYQDNGPKRALEYFNFNFIPYHIVIWNQ